MVADCPWQTGAGELAITVGVVVTFIVTEPDPVQDPVAPTTEYVVVTVGETITVDVVALPALALHINVVALPPARIGRLPPEQSVVVGAITSTVGVGVTFTTTLYDVWQPELSPVTTYVAVEEGETVTVDVVALPALALHV